MRFLMAISVILSLSISHTDGAGGGQFIGAWKKEEGNYYSEIFRDILSYFEIHASPCLGGAQIKPITKFPVKAWLSSSSRRCVHMKTDMA